MRTITIKVQEFDNGSIRSVEKKLSLEELFKQSWRSVGEILTNTARELDEQLDRRE